MSVVVALAIGAIGLSVFPAVAGQARPNRGRALPAPEAGAEGGTSPAEIQRLFDAYTVMQAQQELQLSDDQFPQFLRRVRSLQDARRRGQVERMRRLQVLRKLSQDAAGDESEMRAQLKGLADLEERTVIETRQAMDAVDQVLNLRQQARFRLFEEMMERRKVELLMRARQGNRPRP